MKTEYRVFKEIKGPFGEGDLTASAYLAVGAAEASGPKQAIKTVVATLPEKERLGSYRATPSRSWHSAEVTEKPAELAVS